MEWTLSGAGKRLDLPAHLHQGPRATRCTVSEWQQHLEGEFTERWVATVGLCSGNRGVNRCVVGGGFVARFTGQGQGQCDSSGPQGSQNGHAHWLLLEVPAAPAPNKTACSLRLRTGADCPSPARSPRGTVFQPEPPRLRPPSFPGAAPPQLLGRTS